MRRYAAVRATAPDLAVVVLPASGLGDLAGSFEPAGPSLEGLPLTDGSAWIGVEELGGHRLVLEEQSTYFVRIRSGARGSQPVFLATAPLRRLTAPDADEAVFELGTGNLVGLTYLRAGSGESETRVDIRIRVRKLRDPDADFNWLVQDLSAAVRSLALTVASPTSLPTRRSSRDRSFPYEDLLFLRAVAPLVRHAARRISKNPHRRMVLSPVSSSVSAASRLDPSRLHMLTTPHAGLATVHQDAQEAMVGPEVGRLFSAQGRRALPSVIPDQRPEISLDTYENRFARFVINAFRQRALQVGDAAERASRPHLRLEARSYASMYAAILRDSPFADAGDLHGLMGTSQVLFRDDAYATLLRLYREFLLSSDVNWQDMDYVQESRDVATLYEMWVYVQIVVALTRVGRPASGDDSSFLRVDRDGLTVNLSKGRRSEVVFIGRDHTMTVTYNRTFARATADPRPSRSAASYSLPLRPDVAIEIRSGSQVERIVIDAKYRVDGLAGVFDEVAADDDVLRPSGTFKSADIYKMHTYRDAIGGLRLALVAYPGGESRTYPVSAEALRALGGVGALALQPGDSTSAVESRDLFAFAVQEAVLTSAANLRLPQWGHP